MILIPNLASLTYLRVTNCDHCTLAGLRPHTGRSLVPFSGLMGFGAQSRFSKAQKSNRWMARIAWLCSPDISFEFFHGTIDKYYWFNSIGAIWNAISFNQLAVAVALNCLISFISPTKATRTKRARNQRLSMIMISKFSRMNENHWRHRFSVMRHSYEILTWESHDETIKRAASHSVE